MPFNSNHINVDAVITWVDGNDEQWQRKINPYLEKKIDWSNKKETVRFQSIDEIVYCIQSIIKFAPFIRNIFVVTDTQTPPNFSELQALAEKKGKKLRLVDHKEIFAGFESYLPTFNSRSIGPMLTRIKGLAEHFIFFNDDFFLMKETQVTDFFVEGKPIYRGKWAEFYENRKARKVYLKVAPLFKIRPKVVKEGAKKAQQTGAKVVGLNKYVKLNHTPVALRKSTIDSFFEQNPEVLINNIKYRFRSKDQFIVSSLGVHLEVKSGTAIIKKNLQLTYFQSYRKLKRVKRKLKRFEKSNSKLFTCFQSLEMADSKTQEYIINWIEKRLEN